MFERINGFRVLALGVGGCCRRSAPDPWATARILWKGGFPSRTRTPICRPSRNYDSSQTRFFRAP